CRRLYVFLWLTGFAAYFTLAIAFLWSRSCNLAMPVALPPSTLFWYAYSPVFIEFQAGWYVAVVGILLFWAGAAIDGLLDSRRPTVLPSLEPSASRPWWLQLASRDGRFGEG